MKKRVSLLITLALTAFIAAGCDGIAGFLPKKNETPTEQGEDNNQQEQPSTANFTVSFNANGGTGSMQSDTTDGSTYYVTRDCEFEFAGHIFVAWALNSNQGQRYELGDMIYDIAQNITLFAIWEEINYNVTFNANGGFGTMVDKTTNGSTYIAPICTFTYSNHRFDKWALGSPSGTKYSEGETIQNISSNIILYATWLENTTPQNNYTVTFNANGGTGTMTAETTNGSTYQVPDCSFTYSNHVFTKWALNSVSGQQYAVGQTISNISSDIILFALWQDNNPSPDPYYSTITDSMSGETLRLALNSIINNNSVDVSYAWARYEAADEDPNNSDNIITIYSRRSMTKSSKDNGTNGDYWNREHTFPNSKITGPAENDNHIIYASEKKVNGARSSLKMGVVNNGSIVNDNNGNPTNCQKTANLFDPHNVARGIVARTTMYAAAMYGLSPTDNFESIETMLSWHLEYQPDANDMRRNDVVYQNQKNRNPFVDHPEYACRIWGTTNATTKTLCGM